MNSVTRILCQKYTDLTEEEIQQIESYQELLPALANAEKADVFVDCRTSTGRSAIVVCEAKPQTAPSNYEKSILGMLIRWRDEPAVDRSFRLGVATLGVRAVSMPEDRRIVQSVEPIFCADKLIGVLIYEKAAPAAGALLTGEETCEEDNAGLDWGAVSNSLNDAVIFLDGDDRVCGYNQAARLLYQDMGYVGELLGMPATNIQPSSFMNCDSGCESSMVNHILHHKRVPVSSGKARTALVIRDVTSLRRTEQELVFQITALRELKHRMKNTLHMIASLTRNRSYEADDPVAVQTALLDTANRLLSITATLDGVVQAKRERVSLLQVLEQIRKYALQTLMTPARDITIRVCGEDVEVSADCASSVALVVNELAQNALKYAFLAGVPGMIGIELAVERPLCKITVWDNGRGFETSEIKPGSMGLELAQSIVNEKLTGEWMMESNSSGTRISFDFLEN